MSEIRYVVGLHAAQEALKVRTPQEVLKVYFKSDIPVEGSTLLAQLFQLAQKKSLKIERVSPKKLNKIPPTPSRCLCFCKGRASVSGKKPFFSIYCAYFRRH